MAIHPRAKDLTEVSNFLFNIIDVEFYKYDPAYKKPLWKKNLARMVLSTTAFQLCLQLMYPFCKEPSSIVDTIMIYSLLLYSFNSLLKFYAVYRGRDLLHEVLQGLDSIHPKSKEDLIAYHTKECYDQIRLYGWTTAYFNFAVTTMFNFFPISQSIFEYFYLGKDFLRRFPFYGFYPFDVESAPLLVYILLYGLQNSAGYVVLIFYAASDFLLIETVQIICMHFKYLAHMIENFEPTGSDADLEEMNKFISYHQLLLRLSFNINEVCNISILVNYIVSGGVICVTAFQVTIGFEILDLLKSISSIILSLAFVYLICRFGTDLMEVSTEISQAVFSHKWYMGNKKYRKMVPLIIIRAQKPVFLSAFKFFVVTMESFTMVVKSSYQMFTLLRTTYQDA